MKNKFAILASLVLTMVVGLSCITFVEASSNFKKDMQKAPDVKTEKGVWYTPMFQEDFFNTVISYSEGYFLGGRSLASDPSGDGVVGIYDQNMNLIKQTNYSMASPVNEGVSTVSKSDKVIVNGEELYLCGYMDTTGKEIIPCMYYDVTDFMFGLAIVHKKVGEGDVTLVINKKNEVQFQLDGIHLGDVRGYAVYFCDEDPDLNDSIGYGGGETYGVYYDYKGNKIKIDARKNTYDAYGYWDQFGTRWNVTGYDRNEETTFIEKYGNLYGPDIKSFGRGFFQVSKLLTQEEIDESKSAQSTSVVDKNNKVIIPMGEHDVMYEVTAIDTGTSKFFHAGKYLYDSTGKKFLGPDKFRDVWYAGNNVIYYVKGGNKGWGMMTLTGTDVVPTKAKKLSYFDYPRGNLSNFHEYTRYVPTNVTFFSNADMKLKADTTQLKDALVKAKVVQRDMKNRAKKNNSFKDDLKELTTAISHANTVLAAACPIGINVTTAEVTLLRAINFCKDAMANN